MNASKDDNKSYAAFDHAFTDVWEGKEVSFAFRFARPGKPQIAQMQKTAGKDGGQAARNLLVGIVHPEDKERFLGAIETYPGLTTSFAGAVIKAVGIADLGN